MFLPGIDRAIERARSRGLTSAGPFVYSMLERIVLRLTEPPPRLRTRAPKALQPTDDPSRSASRVMREFMEWQAAIDERIRRADGLDLKRMRERSPALPLVKWSLGTMLAITLAHERRHLWQAREVRNDKRFPAWMTTGREDESAAWKTKRPSRGRPCSLRC